MSDKRIMVELPADEALAITGRIMDRDLEEAALRRIERAVRIEEGSSGSLATARKAKAA